MLAACSSRCALSASCDPRRVCQSGPSPCASCSLAATAAKFRAPAYLRGCRFRRPPLGKTYKTRRATTMTAAAIATMATVDAARIIVPVFSVPLLLKRSWRSCGVRKLGPPANSMFSGSPVRRSYRTRGRSPNRLCNPRACIRTDSVLPPRPGDRVRCVTRSSDPGNLVGRIESCACPGDLRSPSLFWSFCYLALRCLLQLVVLRPRSK
jgi:hypothetical protein